jgi:hypothetical protein
MKYNDKKNDDLEMDELNIKSHLNTSFDLSGISVSEDLINRTLAAIKEQPAEKKEQQSGSEELGKKIIPWSRYVRRFAGVAAAVLIVAVGYNVIKQVPLGSHKDSSTNTESQKNSINSTLSDEAPNQNFGAATTEEAAPSDDTNANSSEIATTDATEKESAVQYTITADTSIKDGGEGVTGSESDEATDFESKAGSIDAETDSADLGEQKASVALRNSNGTEVFTFREIFLPDPTAAEYITIKDEINKTSITLTDQAEILDFYTVMDAHQFTNGTENSANQNYTVELKSPEPEALYTLLVGDNLTVRYFEGDEVVESIYDAVDKDLLKQNLDELYQKYSE